MTRITKPWTNRNLILRRLKSGWTLKRACKGVCHYTLVGKWVVRAKSEPEVYGEFVKSFKSIFKRPKNSQKFTSRRTKKIITALQAGATLELASKISSVTSNTVVNWMKKGELEFKKLSPTQRELLKFYVGVKSARGRK